MSTTKSEFLNELKARGYVHQVTDEAALDKLARSETITGYIGFDCTAPSLHVGNLLGIMMLRKLQQAGHRPIVLIGGGTTKVGDPSGKDEARKLLTDAEIAANIGGIESVFGKFVSFGKATTMRSSSTTPTGSTNSTTSISCATMAGISASTACCPTTR